MNKKELNNKVWYRAVKVLFVMISILFIGGSVVAGYFISSQSNIDTVYKCKHGNGEIVHRGHISVYGGDGSDISAVKKIREACRSTSISVSSLNKENYVTTFDEFYSEKGTPVDKMTTYEILDNLTENNYETSKTAPSIGYAFLGFIGSVILVILLAKIFLYILLGKPDDTDFNS